MIKVIIVEDDPMVREINSKLIEKIEGYKVDAEARTIQEAKEILEDNEYDLLILDVFLPDGKGIDLLKWIRKQEIKIDIILVTADKCSDSVDDAFRYGAIDYLIKPFKFDRLNETLIKFKERNNNIKSLKDLDQNSIDQYILKRESGKITSALELEKGLNLNTYEKIIGYIKSKNTEKLKAEDIANETGLARVTVRRYLEKMADEGKVSIIQEYGRIGRPTNYYMFKN